MKYLEKNKGITLIALIVTIVVLLILAGVTINAITGNESAMEKATQAREENKLGEELEQIKLCVVNAMSQGLDGKVSDNDLRTALNGIVAQSEIEKITGTGPWIIQGNSGREYKITNGGNVNALDTMDKAIINPISVEERSKVPIVISNGDNIEEIKSCTIADTSIATAAKDTDGIWKITGGIITGDEQELTTTMTIEGKSGKKIENISVALLKVTTAKDVIPVPTSSATSAYVKYAMNGQTANNAEMCRVLYNDDEHGLQIITENSVQDVTLGRNDPKITDETNGTLAKAQKSYNRAIVSLNEYAVDYKNTDKNIALDARCVGSIPIITLNTTTNQYEFLNKNNEELLTNPNNYSLVNTYVEQRYKGEDNNYEADRQQLQTIGILNSNETYWLASRSVKLEDSAWSKDFAVRSNVTGAALWLVISSNGARLASGNPYGFRPVFLINPTAKIKSGAGTSGDPYILEVGE